MDSDHDDQNGSDTSVLSERGQARAELLIDLARRKKRIERKTWDLSRGQSRDAGRFRDFLLEQQLHIEPLLYDDDRHTPPPLARRRADTEPPEEPRPEQRVLDPTNPQDRPAAVALHLQEIEEADIPGDPLLWRTILWGHTGLDLHGSEKQAFARLLVGWNSEDDWVLLRFDSRKKCINDSIDQKEVLAPVKDFSQALVLQEITKEFCLPRVDDPHDTLAVLHWVGRCRSP